MSKKFLGVLDHYPASISTDSVIEKGQIIFVHNIAHSSMCTVYMYSTKYFVFIVLKSLSLYSRKLIYDVTYFPRWWRSEQQRVCVYHEKKSDARPGETKRHRIFQTTQCNVEMWNHKKHLPWLTMKIT